MDEVILKESSVPILRSYRWERPAASFGYFENYEAVATQHAGRDLVRRWTGGGVVLHGDDFTYSLMVPAGFSLVKSSTAESYRLIHEQIAKTMQGSGLPAKIASQPAEKISRACFENPVTSDLLLDNRKIAGAAQRRTRHGLLHQGSIQILGLPPKFALTLAANLADEILQKTIEDSEVAAAQALSEKKYATQAWLKKF
ncbi:MAG: hypothetical protein WCD79_22060 [Chthoniobacteraceae bacterium]